MSTLKVNNLQAESGTTISVASGHVLHAPGHVIQTVTMNQTDQVQSAFTTSTDLFSLSITPKFSSSKILITGNIAFHADDADSYFSVTLNRGQGDALMHGVHGPQTITPVLQYSIIPCNYVGRVDYF